MLNKTTVQLLALGLIGSMAAPATAEDSALIDALVRKGVLKQKEAEQLRKDACCKGGSSGKLSLNESVKELRLSGDIRLRYQASNAQDNVAAATQNNEAQSFRLRLRINADYKLNDDFFAGFGIGNGSGRTNHTPRLAGSNGNNEYFANGGAFITKAFIGWKPFDGVTLIGGKQTIPFYTTSMVWDPELFPAGFTEKVDLNKVFGISGIKLSFVAGQYLVNDNPENATNTVGRHDAWIYQTQVVASTEIAHGVNLTLAPGYYSSNSGNATIPGIAGVAALTDALANYQTLLLPGDISTTVAGVKAKFLWDFAYNFAGPRDQGAIGLRAGLPAGSASNSENTAFLLGIKLGENHKSGDLSFAADYRRVGLSSVDPFLTDSNWSLGNALNMSGFKLGLKYNLSNAVTLGAAFFYSDNIRANIGGLGVPQNGSQAANVNNMQMLQVDLGVKF